MSVFSSDRRRFLMGALASGLTIAHAPSVWGAADFWNTKDPSTWNEEEITTLTTKSPWARLAALDIKDADDPTGTSGASARGGRGTGLPPVMVLWASAQPILDALKVPLPADFAGHYMLSVANLPIANPRRVGREGEADDIIDRLQAGTLLQVKGKDPAQAGIARRTRIGSIVFGFRRDVLRLEPTDRDIDLVVDVKQFRIKARFDGKEMRYHGNLAV